MLKFKPKHFAISVADMEASINWYRDILGFEITGKEYAPNCGSNITIMSNGIIDVEIFLHDDTQPMSPERSDPDLDVKTQGLKHMCFAVEDLNETIEYFKSKGVKILVGPVDFASNKLIYITDNSGNLLEFMQ